MWGYWVEREVCKSTVVKKNKWQRGGGRKKTRLTQTFDLMCYCECIFFNLKL